MATVSGPTVKSVFGRIDTNHDGVATRAEVLAMVKAAKVGGGIFGGIEQSLATDAFMDQLDANNDGKIAMDEVMTKLTALVGASGQTEPGQVTQKALEWFDTADTSHDGKLNQAELKKTIQTALENSGQSMADKKADIASKIGIYLADENHDGVVGRGEVEALAQDVEAQTKSASVA